MAQDESMMDKIKDNLGMNKDSDHEQEQDELGPDDHAQISEEMSQFEEEPAMNRPTFGERLDDESDMEVEPPITEPATTDAGDYNADDIARNDRL